MKPRPGKKDANGNRLATQYLIAQLTAGFGPHVRDRFVEHRDDSLTDSIAYEILENDLAEYQDDEVALAGEKIRKETPHLWSGENLFSIILEGCKAARKDLAASKNRVKTAGQVALTILGDKMLMDRGLDNLHSKLKEELAMAVRLQAISRETIDEYNLWRFVAADDRKQLQARKS